MIFCAQLITEKKPEPNQKRTLVRLTVAFAKSKYTLYRPKLVIVTKQFFADTDPSCS